MQMRRALETRSFDAGVIGRLVLLGCLFVPLLAAAGRGQESPSPKRVLALHWYGKDFPSNVAFDRGLLEVFRSNRSGTVIEYYPEYLESDRFPGENQSRLFRDYLRRKYADHRIDAVIAFSAVSLNFLLKYSSDLFPDVPIVFHTFRRPRPADPAAAARLTGVVASGIFRNTLALALQLHPATEQVFVITGTPERDKVLETDVREELKEFESKVELTYLSDLPLDELISGVRSAPDRSLIFYVRYSQDKPGKKLDPFDALTLVAQSAKVPVYSVFSSTLGRGSVGGHSFSVEASGARVAEIALQVANGAQPKDIPMAVLPTVPVFDWRQLRRWGIAENQLPRGSTILFREPSVWDLHKWHILPAVLFGALQTILIGALLIERHRRRKNAEALGKAEGANRAKSIFLANMSHELRTPLSAILGFSDLLRNSPGIPPEERKDLDIINRNGEHLLGLINDVLDMAKIDAGAAEIVKSPMDLRELVRDIMDLMGARAAQKGLELTLEQSRETPRFVRADEEKLRQILLNLIGNAVKYTDTGRVTLRLDTVSATDLQDRVLVMDVEDSGIGISAEDQARIFDPFVQAGKLSTQKGSGLGLAITKNYVELMGGTIRVVSEAGQGSIFRVEVPVGQAEGWEMPPARANPGRVTGQEPGQPEYRILIIEDQVENWLLLQRLLDNAGFRVRVASDAEAGIAIFADWRPHFIWMDWRLPGIDGLEATRRIRALDGGTEAKIVMLTAFAFGEQGEEALAAGVDDFVRKPFQAEDIFDCLARHLGVRYTYQKTPADQPALALRKEALVTLPEEERERLIDVLISLDAGRIGRAIERISKRDAELGKALAAHADRFAYTAILDALEAGQGRTWKAPLEPETGACADPTPAPPRARKRARRALRSVEDQRDLTAGEQAAGAQ
jgi:signal transduction histidine kinase/DNA-binding response OmpR family regulator